MARILSLSCSSVVKRSSHVVRRVFSLLFVFYIFFHTSKCIYDVYLSIEEEDVALNETARMSYISVSCHHKTAVTSRLSTRPMLRYGEEVTSSDRQPL